VTDAAPRPRLAVIVSNAITGDSRVQKTALSAAHAGWDVLLVGRAQSDRVERTWLGPVRVVRVPVRKTMKDREDRRRRRTARARLTQIGLPTAESATEMRAAHESRARLRSKLIGRFSGPEAPLGALVPRLGLKVWRRLLDQSISVRNRAFEWEERHRRDVDRPVGDWRRDWPALLDLDLAFGPVIERFEPDVIHANDITMINTAATTAGRMRAAGKRVSWLYDAHEYVAGVEWPYPRMMSAYPAVERALIGQADAVVSVSPEIAAIIRDDHHLPETPLVVRNTPVRTAVGTSSASVRAAAGVGTDVPLLVYSGYIHPERSIGTAVEALPELPGVHLAIVSNQANRELRSILRRADELGVTDRVHVVPYVAQHEVADYLSSADLGVICSQQTINYELSLPTKLAEYLHAGLPVVVSDLKTLSAFVRDHHVGEVFAGDPASFRLAAEAALADRETLAAAITDDLRDSLSWETQVAGLLELYTSLSGKAPTSPDGEEHSWDVRERPRSLDERRPSRRPWRRLAETPIRLGLGPANFAGQLGEIARAITTTRADVSAEVFVRDAGSPFRYPADVVIPARRLKRLDGQVEQLQRILPRYTHLLADAFRPVFGTLNGEDIAGDLPALAEHGIKVALLAHGTDVRHPLRHLDRVPHSLFRDVPDEETLQERLRTAERNRRIADESGLPLFVTTPDLLEDLPQATWTPLIVDVDAWACDRPVMGRPRPLVLHAPSKRWTKGTSRILTQLEDLDARNLIELRLAEGLPWQEMRALVQDADVVIDQFGVGAYGVLACEAMAAGKPVLAYLTESVVQAIGETPPIVNTRPEDVAAAIGQLLDDRAEAAQIGRRSAEYARRFHDGTRSVEALQKFLTPR
jgi:glycosyltransferase involved in cell wall biosynthesis